MPPPDLVERQFVKLAGYFLPASQCGGDWWTVHDMPDGRVLVVIGDVTGHGVPSAMITAAAKAACDVVRATEGDDAHRHAPARDHEPRHLRERQAQVRHDLLRVDPRPEDADHHLRQRRAQLPVPLPARRAPTASDFQVAHVARQPPRRSRGVDLHREDAPSSSPATSSSGTPTASSSARTSAARSTARSASARPSAAPPSSTRSRCARASSAPPDSSSASARARTTSPWCSRGSTDERRTRAARAATGHGRLHRRGG